jgi:hypothetical protein
MDQSAVVNLSNLAKGGVMEVFEHELDRVVKNIRDPNADPKKKRRITVAIEIAPYPDRSGAEITSTVVAKLVPINAVKSTMFIGVVNGEAKPFTKDIRQEELNFEERKNETQPSNVLPMNGTTNK